MRNISKGLPVAGALLILGAVFAISSAAAQQSAPVFGTPGADVALRAKIDKVLRGIDHGRPIGQVAISPNGKRLAWVDYSRDGVEIRVAPLNDLSKSERVTAGGKPDDQCQENQIAWQPDGKALAFFSDCLRPGEQMDLYLSHIDGTPARRLTTLKGYEQDPAFSPDGTQVAFLYVEGATRPAGAMAAMKPPAGVIGQDGVEVQRVAVARVDAESPAPPAMATPANLHVYEFDWRPDSKGMAYVSADPPGENNWWVAKLYTQSLDGAPKAILAPAEVKGPLHGLQIAVPRWSPDGKAIAFIGGLMSDQGSTGGDVWIIPSEGGEAKNLTPRRSASPAWIEWAGAEELFVSELAGGNAQLVLLRLHSKDGCTMGAGVHGPVFSVPATVGDGRMEMSLSSGENHRLFVFRASGPEHPVEIWSARADNVFVGCAGSEQANLIQLSHWNDGLDRAWGKTVSLNWENEGFHVQGWLMLPKEYDPAKKYPLIVDVHGGPAAAALARWNGGGMNEAAFSALGYFVLQPNPRGSFGQGEQFAQANRKDFGYGDLRDILAGVDRVVAQYPIDPDRVGIMGWSYGGFMSMFAVTQTHRFKAAVAGAGISNWQSYYGENSIDQWMTPYFGASVYDDPAVYAKSSAINYIKQVTTSTLVLVGDRDGECPAPQSFEFWHALRALHVPTELVVYPNEGHGFSDPAHRRDVFERAVEWFARYMPPSQ